MYEEAKQKKEQIEEYRWAPGENIVYTIQIIQILQDRAQYLLHTILQIASKSSSSSSFAFV
jgi:hypothetical protein